MGVLDGQLEKSAEPGTRCSCRAGMGNLVTRPACKWAKSKASDRHGGAGLKRSSLSFNPSDCWLTGWGNEICGGGEERQGF